MRPLAALLALIAAAPVGAADIAIAPGAHTLAAAIASAAQGDTLHLAVGRYGPAVIDRPLALVGVQGTVLDAGGTGTVLVVDAPDVDVVGLTVTGSGRSHETLDAGIKLTAKAARTRVAGNRLLDNLHGVDVHGAAGAVVEGNEIVGMDDRRMNARGNGVYVWNAPGAVVRGNAVRLGRDGIFVNTSRDNVFADNVFTDLRFAVHFMYSDGSRLTGNVSRGNNIGYAVMFTRDVVISGNVSDGDRDHGIMLNYANDALIEGNVVIGGGEKCLFMYNANRNMLAGNRFEGCPIGIHFTAGSERNTITGNVFAHNRTQVKYVGTTDHEWSADGVGNYWSDNAAFDLDGNGIADRPYRPNDMIDHVLWTAPAAKLLLGSPAVQLVRWAQSTFPALLPGGIVDSAPLVVAPRIGEVLR